MQVPDGLLYTEEHEWILSLEDSMVKIGITDYAQDQLGDVVFVELPEVGKTVAKDDVLAEVESTKSVGEVYAPFPGTIASVNEAVSSSPELVNQSPYEDGWLVTMSVEGEIPSENLLDAAGYRTLTE
ncbi:MAG TPA: glycine cleavage system protein GcvH [Acidimicrobiia bacterium]